MAADLHSDGHWLSQAVTMATDNVTNGGGPFGALVVLDGAIAGVGENRVTRDLDPTAHAEVMAIRRSCQLLDTFSLAGATLYTSCEPCPLCMSAALWARVTRVVYAADRDDAARGGFDDREFYELFTRPRHEWPIEIIAGVHENSPAPFDAWLARPDRVAY